MNNKILYYFSYKGESLGAGTKVILNKSFMYESCGIDEDIVSYYSRTEIRNDNIFLFFTPAYTVRPEFLCPDITNGKKIPNEVFVKIENVEAAVKEVLQKKIVEKKEPDKDAIFAYTLIYLLVLFFSLIFTQFYLAWIYATVVFINKIKEEYNEG